jgi:hypothetical protein
VIWVCYLGGWLFVGVVIAFILPALNEFYNLISAKGASPHARTACSAWWRRGCCP